MESSNDVIVTWHQQFYLRCTPSLCDIIIHWHHISYACA